MGFDLTEHVKIGAEKGHVKSGLVENFVYFRLDRSIVDPWKTSTDIALSI